MRITFLVTIVALWGLSLSATSIKWNIQGIEHNVDTTFQF